MSKETTKAKILANLAGQGSMIDISGKLPAILDEIIELIPEGGGGPETIVIEGTMQTGAGESDMFHPSAGQPAFDTIFEKFIGGALVYFKYTDKVGYDVVAKVVTSAESETYGKGLVAIGSEDFGGFPDSIVLRAISWSSI